VTSQPYDAASRSEKVMARVTAVVVVVLLTLLTQIGGLVMLLVALRGCRHTARLSIKRVRPIFAATSSRNGPSAALSTLPSVVALRVSR
jgi:hypothetical protein